MRNKPYLGVMPALAPSVIDEMRAIDGLRGDEAARRLRYVYLQICSARYNLARFAALYGVEAAKERAEKEDHPAGGVP